MKRPVMGIPKTPTTDEPEGKATVGEPPFKPALGALSYKKASPGKFSQHTMRVGKK